MDYHKQIPSLTLRWGQNGPRSRRTWDRGHRCLLWRNTRRGTKRADNEKGRSDHSWLLGRRSCLGHGLIRRVACIEVWHVLRISQGL